MQKIFSFLTSFPACRCGSSWGRWHSGAVSCWLLCRFWTFVGGFMFACKQQRIKQEALLIRTALECSVALGCTERLMRFPSTADLSFPCLVRSRSTNESDYLIVTSSVCGTQHPERLGGCWHFSCPKGHADWVMYQSGGIYASLGQLVTNRCKSSATLISLVVFRC